MNTTKQINIIVALIFLSIFATGAYWMWDPDRADRSEEEQLETTVWRGAFLFSQNCRVCHGDSGEGGQRANRLREAPPLDRDDLKGISSETGEVDAQLKRTAFNLVLNTLNCGRVGKAMPVWGVEQGGSLTDEQMRQLATLITEGTGWEDAKEFAEHGFPKGDVHGDAEVAFALAEAIGVTDTTITLSGDLSALTTEDQLQVDDELMGIDSINAGTGVVTVERGFGTTTPAEHGLDATLLRRASGSAVPPDPVPTVQASCGQVAGAAAPTGTPEPPSATLEITSQGIAFDKSELHALPDVPLTLTHHHNDPGQQHNVAIYANEEAAVTGEAPIAATDIAGPGDQVLEFGPLALGEYYYQCDVHPQMNGILIVEPATATATDGAAADGAAATETPAP
jgi:plastocyanin/mono/diheme cytochrome c family protein